MDRRWTIHVAAVSVVVVFAFGIWSAGDTLKPSWLRFFSTAVLVATLVIAAWDKWIWRTRLAQKVPGVPRDIRGTWSGTLTSFWIDPATGRSPAAKAAYLVIRQTASSVIAIMLTDESWSRSSVADLSDDGARVSLSYMYLNRPDSRFENRSRMHNGSVFLEISGRPASRIRGRYWTDRDSRGELEFNRKESRLVEDFREATELFQPET